MYVYSDNLWLNRTAAKIVKKCAALGQSQMAKEPVKNSVAVQAMVLPTIIRATGTSFSSSILLSHLSSQQQNEIERLKLLFIFIFNFFWVRGYSDTFCTQAGDCCDGEKTLVVLFCVYPVKIDLIATTIIQITTTSALRVKSHPLQEPAKITVADSIRLGMESPVTATTC